MCCPCSAGPVTEAVRAFLGSARVLQGLDQDQCGPCCGSSWPVWLWLLAQSWHLGQERAHCLQEAILCPLGDFHVHINFNPDLIMAQATIAEVKKRGKTIPDTFSLAFKKILNNVISCLKRQSLAAKHIRMWYGRCWYPLPTAVTYTHSCIANCLPSNELAQISALLHMLGLAGCISASLLFILQKPFSLPAVIFRNWQVGFCKLIKFILNMDVTLHQKTMKRQEIRSRTYPSLCQIWLVSTERF